MTVRPPVGIQHARFPHEKAHLQTEYFCTQRQTAVFQHSAPSNGAQTVEQNTSKLVDHVCAHVLAHVSQKRLVMPDPEDGASFTYFVTARHCKTHSRHNPSTSNKTNQLTTKARSIVHAFKASELAGTFGNWVRLAGHNWNCVDLNGTG